jgi:hypothetical protein
MNEAIFERWVNAHDVNYQPALKSLKGKIKHISHNDFLSSLKVSISKFLKLNLKNFVTLVEPLKSNQWVAELAHYRLGFKSPVYGRLGEENAFMFSLAMQEKAYANEEENLKNIVLFDDGSFSGNQLHNHIKTIGNLCPKSTVHVIVPFITKAAVKKITSIENVLYKIYYDKIILTLKSSYSQPNEGFSFLSKITDIFWENVDYKKRQEMTNKGMVWFDHNIPNSMSFPKPLATGKLLGTEKKIRFLPRVTPSYKEG